MREQVNRIRTALAEGSFVPVFQPVAEVGTGRIVSVETLARLREPTGHLTTPDNFLDAAERFGFITQIDRIVIAAAFERLSAARLTTVPNLEMAINLSGLDFEDDSLVADISRLARAKGIRPERVTFEITETAVLRDLARVQNFTRALTAEGFRFALDDFGVGFSSFRYLRELPVSSLKLDISLRPEPRAPAREPRLRPRHHGDLPGPRREDGGGGGRVPGDSRHRLHARRRPRAGIPHRAPVARPPAREPRRHDAEVAVLKGRRALRRAGRLSRLGIDVLLLLLLGALLAGLVALAQRWEAPMRAAVEIDLSPWALPGYTLLSLSRGFAAYILSLLFTLAVGTAAAHSRRAERVLIPLLDIGQGIPVLGFLPGLVLGMVALFPRTNVGLELACILMIFTGQVWNMAFSYYGSVRALPTELNEVARIHRFGWWRRFRTVELSASVIGLVWNSMLSMAGGWFFLTVNEAFTLGDRDFRLPGIGSYMAVAIEKGDGRAIAWALVAMTTMIVAVDQLLWRPLVAWSQRFRLGDISGADAPTSWVLDLIRRSTLLRRLGRALRAARERRPSAARPLRRPRRRPARTLRQPGAPPCRGGSPPPPPPRASPAAPRSSASSPASTPPSG